MNDPIPGSLDAALADLRERATAMRSVGALASLEQLEALLAAKRDGILWDAESVHDNPSA